MAMHKCHRACVHMLGDELPCIQACSRTGSLLAESSGASCQIQIKRYKQARARCQMTSLQTSRVRPLVRPNLSH